MSTRGTKLQLEMPRSWFQIRLGSLDRNQILESRITYFVITVKRDPPLTSET